MKLNDYPNFPCVGQVFAIQRHAISKKAARTQEKSSMAFPIIPRNPPMPRNL
jgi:hypothetical protein